MLAAIIRTIASSLLLACACLAISPRALAQDEVLMPEQSAAKAKQFLQQAIDALGGPAYLNVHDVTCTGRMSQFDHSGELSGFDNFIDYAQPPDKDRTENLPKRNIIYVFNGDKGWDLDRGGVSEAPSRHGHLSGRHQEGYRQHSAPSHSRAGHDFPLWRPRRRGLPGSRLGRISGQRQSHLPHRHCPQHAPARRKVVDTRDANTRMRTEEIEYYSNYHPIDGIQTPFQITRERNGIKIYQVFFDKFEYNTGVADALFTKESLDERWEKVGKKEKDQRQAQRQK